MKGDAARLATGNSWDKDIAGLLRPVMVGEGEALPLLDAVTCLAKLKETR